MVKLTNSQVRWGLVLLAILSRYFLYSDSFRERACLWLWRYAPRIRADGSGIGRRFVFGVLRIQAWDCLWRLALASGMRFGCLVCTFGKALRMQECAIVLGAQLPGRQKSGSTVRSAGKSWKLGGGKVFAFPLVSRECSPGKERLTRSSVVPDGWI